MRIFPESGSFNTKIKIKDGLIELLHWPRTPSSSPRQSHRSMVCTPRPYITSASGTPNFLSSCSAFLRDNLRRSASVPVTVRFTGVWLVASSWRHANQGVKVNCPRWHDRADDTQTRRSRSTALADTTGLTTRKPGGQGQLPSLTQQGWRHANQGVKVNCPRWRDRADDTQTRGSRSTALADTTVLTPRKPGGQGQLPSLTRQSWRHANQGVKVNCPRWHDRTDDTQTRGSRSTALADTTVLTTRKPGGQGQLPSLTRQDCKVNLEYHIQETTFRVNIDLYFKY